MSSADPLHATAPCTQTTLFASLNYVAPMRERPQFHANDQSLDRVSYDPHTVPIEDGRNALSRPTLDREGFQLLPCPTQVREFRDTAEVAARYPDEIIRFMRDLTGADAIVVTGAPVLRFAERSPEAGTRDNSRAARLVHIDVSDQAAAEFAAKAVPSGARRIRRTAQHNIWRAFSAPPQDVPLALCDARTLNAEDLVLADARFDKNGTVVWSFEALLLRYNSAHRWWYFSDLERDEVLVFKRHDTDPGQPHHVAHSGFSDPRVTPDHIPRASVEIRTIAYWFD